MIWISIKYKETPMTSYKGKRILIALQWINIETKKYFLGKQKKLLSYHIYL